MASIQQGCSSHEAGQLLIDERRQHVLSLIQNKGRAVVSELSHNFGISQITIRKDLDYLHSRGLIQRTRGGALRIQSRPLFDLSLQELQRKRPQDKLRIAAAAAKMVEEGQCVMLNSGATTMGIAQELRTFSQLTVITNDMNVAIELTDTDLEIILIGGSLRKNSFSLVGPLTEDLLHELHADILFLSVDGFDPEIGLTTPNILECRVNRAMVKAARRLVAVCDSTKLARRSLSRIVPASAVDTVITDRGLSSEMAEALRAQNINLVLA